MRKDTDDQKAQEAEASGKEEPKPSDFIVHITEGIDPGESMHRKQEPAEASQRAS